VLTETCVAATAGAVSGFAFGAAPVTKAHLGARSYFSFTLQPGGVARDAVVVSNTAAAPVTLKLGASAGTTANGSGDGYAGAYGGCRAAACWIHGLPATVTLPAKGRKTLAFTVSVPSGTPLRQYLAGITIEPAQSGGPTSLGSKGGAGAQAVITRQVNVGVAITVGSLSQLVSRLLISAVSTSSIGTTPRLLVHERNVGQTFVHAKGAAVCTANGGRYWFSVVSETVLPGDTAVLTVNAPGLPGGKTASCTVKLNSATGGSAAWRGTVHVPKLTSTPVVHTAPGVYTALPKKTTPWWAFALVGIGAAAVVLLGVLVVVVLRRKPPAAA